MNASVAYNKQIKGVRNTVEFDSIEQMNQFLTNRLFNNPSENINLRSSIYKKIRKIRYKFDGIVSFSKYIQEINNNIQINRNNNYSYSFGIETFFDNFPNIEIGFKRNIGKFTSSNNISEFITNEPFLTIDYDFLKRFIFSFDYIYV